MNPSSTKALHAFVRQLSGHASFEKVFVSSLIHGQLGLSTRCLSLVTAPAFPTDAVSLSTPLAPLLEACPVHVRGDAAALLGWLTRIVLGRPRPYVEVSRQGLEFQKRERKEKTDGK